MVWYLLLSETISRRLRLGDVYHLSDTRKAITLALLLRHHLAMVDRRREMHFVTLSRNHAVEKRLNFMRIHALPLVVQCRPKRGFEISKQVKTFIIGANLTSAGNSDIVCLNSKHQTQIGMQVMEIVNLSLAAVRRYL